MRTATVRTLLLALLVVAHTVALEAQSPAWMEGLDDYVGSAVAAWEVPALAIAIVADDSVVYARGFGVLELGGSEPVDEHTIFGIGSTTKAFTAAALAMLIDERHIGWDDPVVEHLAWFRLYDPYVTANITIRDLLSHTSGLSRGDRMWYTRHFDRTEVVRRVRHQEPSWSFRQRYGYSNTMFTAAGLVVDAVTGTSWDEFVERRIFRPLGMSRTTTTVRGLEDRPNVAIQYTSVAGRPARIPRWNQDNIGPAGSINSSVSDLSEWVRLQLGGGSIDGDELLSSERVREMHEAQIAIRGATSSVGPTPMFSAYGLGWRLQEHRGRKLVWHGGGGHGVAAQVALVPEEDLGIVVLSNMDGQSLPTALVFHVIDAFVGASDTDWSAAYLARQQRSLARAAERESALAASRVAGTTPSRPLEDYVGTYWHPYYDVAEVWREGDRLRLRFVSDIEGPLEHWHYDTFRGHWEHPRYGKNLVTFLLGADGAVEAIRIPPEADRSILVDFRRLEPGEEPRQ